MAENKTLLTFPCVFPIKVFGLANTNFEAVVFACIRQHINDFAESNCSKRLSKDNKYLALTVSVNVNSQQQLDDIYKSLTASPEVLMVL